MKSYVLVYEGFVQFEVILASYLLKHAGDIITVGITKDPVVSAESYKVIPDITIDEVDVDEVDAFIVPGGFPDTLFDCATFYTLLEKLNSGNKVIGAICSAPLHLAKANVLQNKKFTTTMNPADFSEFDTDNFVNQNYVTDGNIITAKANGYVDFGIEIGKMVGIYEDEADYQETIDYFKYFKG